jgi:choice-of-anchor A domain-containing protein
MKRLPVAFLTFGLVGCFAANYASADSLSLGLSYNLVALTGGINYSGPDIEGGIAAAGDVVFDASQSYQVLSVGQKFWPNASTPNAIVAGGTISATNGAHISINGGGTTSGNAVSAGTLNSSTFLYSIVPPASSYVIPNEGGTLTQGTYWVDSGLSSLGGLAKTMSANYAAMSTEGTSTVTVGNRLNLNVVNPLAKGQQAYVFNITAAQFSSTSQELWINSVPAGATVVINVTGCSGYTSGSTVGCLLNSTPFLNGNELVNADYSHIVFNFTDPKATAQFLTIPNSSQSQSGNGTQLDGFILAPYATLEGGGDVGGTIWVGSDASSGELHYTEFTGDSTPPSPHPPSIVTPEPGTLGLLGTGVLMLAGLVRRRFAS